MAINYTLAKVYALSDNDPEFVMQIITLFVTEVPEDLKQIDLGIKTKDHKLAYSYAHKIKPSLDLLNGPHQRDDLRYPHPIKQLRINRLVGIGRSGIVGNPGSQQIGRLQQRPLIPSQDYAAARLSDA